MIKKFESFSTKEDVLDYFNNIVDSGSTIICRYIKNDRSGRRLSMGSDYWYVTLKGPVEILESDNELKFLHHIYIELREFDSDHVHLGDNLLISDDSYPEYINIIRKNPFFNRILKISNLSLHTLEIYSDEPEFEIIIQLKVI